MTRNNDNYPKLDRLFEVYSVIILGSRAELIQFSHSFELELELDPETKCCVTSTTKWDKVEEIIGEHYR